MTSCGREPAADAVRGGYAEETGPMGSVWVADSPTTGGRLFLCGTIHILRREDYPLAPAYEAAYASSQRLVFELPPGAAAGDSSTRMRELGALPAGTTLETEAGEQVWKGVRTWCESRGIPASTLSRLRPWFVSLMITNTEYGALGASPEMGVDQHFEKRAQRDGKPAEGLETLEFQLQLFAGLDARLQQAMLEQTLAEVSTLEEEYEKMIKAWKHGRLDDLHAMLFREAAKYPELMEIFLSARNHAWVTRLEALLAEGEKAMVLVGTGHFTGEDGLLELLRGKGYTVRHYHEMPRE